MGGNVGDRAQKLRQAMNGIEKSCGRIIQQSSFYETAAWGKVDQRDFLNVAIGIETTFEPQELLAALQKIEQQLGRERVEKWGERTIDIDVIFYNGRIVDEANLVIPHPLMAERRFVLEPLNEIVPDIIHPILKKPVKQLLRECTDQLTVALYNQ